MDGVRAGLGPNMTNRAAYDGMERNMCRNGAAYAQECDGLLRKMHGMMLSWHETMPSWYEPVHDGVLECNDAGLYRHCDVLNYDGMRHNTRRNMTDYDGMGLNMRRNRTE